MSSGPDTMGELVRAFNFRVNLVKSAAAVEGAKDRAAASRLPTVPRGSTAPPPNTIGNGGFQECTGLEIELDVQELQEGGRNDGVIRRVGRAKYQPLTLKRGMFSAAEPGAKAFTELWGWLQQVASGAHVIRYDGTIEVLNARGDSVVATWTFVRGLPSKISGPQLNARTGEVAIEELQIAHEGLTLELRT